MDKRTLLAVILSVLILIAYQELISFLYPPPPPKPGPSQPLEPAEPVARPAPESEEEKSKPPAEASTAAAQAPATPAGRDITVENEVYTAILTSQGGRLTSLRLKHYPGDEGRESSPLEMVHRGTFGKLPLAVQLEGKEISISDDAVMYEGGGQNLQLQGNDTASLTFIGRTAEGVGITKVFSFTGQTYGITLTVNITGAPENSSWLSLVWVEGRDPFQHSSYSVHGPAALIERKFIQEAPPETEQLFGPGRVRWAGYVNNYFLAAMVPPEGEYYRLLFSSVDGTVSTKLTQPWEKNPVSYTVYVGPKEFQALNAVHPSLDRAIDFGWFHVVARPLVSLLQFSHWLTGNYGIDIILLTVLVKLAFFPLSQKSFRSMAEMRKLQPQLERLREQYKDNREQLNKEMMELYRRYKINPLGGCLPMVVQLPVFIGLYQVLMYAIELRQAPFVGWIQDLSQPDRLGTLALPFIEPPGIPVLTVLMGGTMLWQQAITPAMGDPLQQKMMMIMPLVFTLTFVNFPSGLVLYWLVNNILSIAQQVLYTRTAGA